MKTGLERTTTTITNLTMVSNKFPWLACKFLNAWPSCSHKFVQDNIRDMNTTILH